MMRPIDFNTIKQGVSIRTLLRQYGVQLRRSGKDQYRGRCPIHGGEGRDAFHANLERNVFHCFSCGAGGTVLDFVTPQKKSWVDSGSGNLPSE
jgi:DNA primase